MHKLNRLPAVLLAIILIALTFTPAMAADVTLAWDANSESNLAGYKLFWTTTSPDPARPVFTNDVDVGNKTEYTADNLKTNTTYYFAVKAYNAAGQESGYSDILAYTVNADRIIIRVLDRPKNIRTDQQF